MSNPSAFAVCAHPDDIEFMMAGTLILLGRAGYELHYMTVANGSCGTFEYEAETIVKIRTQEARSAAQLIGATYHPPLTNDAEIFFEKPLLQKMTAVVREVAPSILLTHPPMDYMEDHMNACRLATTAAFLRGMPNYSTDPRRSPVSQDVTVYHALPHGLRDPLRRPARADLFVDITPVIDLKRAMLAQHHSQKAWLDATQGMNAYLDAMQETALAVGQMSRHFTYAEGWTRHLHFGYCAEHANPLLDALGNRAFEIPIEDCT